MKPLPPASAPAESPEDERHLQRLQRMAMLGTLASGLGHDLRNLVMPIMLRLDALGAAADLPASARRDLAGIRESVAQVQRLAAGLRLLGTDPFDPHDEAMVTALPAWFRDVRPIIADALPSHAVLEEAIPAVLPLVAVPPGMLTQVVITLVMNARRATEDRDAPRLGFSARVREDRVCLDVTDNGRGMDEETRLRCFEPFFTTRPREYGTGLGLSSARALLHRYGGDLTTDAGPAEGATFTLHLPLATIGGSAGHEHTHRVHLAIGDPRRRAVLQLLLTQHGMEEWRPGQAGGADVMVCDAEAVAALPATVPPGPDTPPRIIAIGNGARATSRSDLRWVDADDLAGLAALLGRP